MPSEAEVIQMFKAAGLKVTNSGMVIPKRVNITGRESVPLYGFMQARAFAVPVPIDEEPIEFSYEIIQSVEIDKTEDMIIHWGSKSGCFDTVRLQEYILKLPKPPKPQKKEDPEKQPKMPRDLAGLVEAAPYPTIQDNVAYDVLFERIVVNPDIWGGPEGMVPLDDQHLPAYHKDLIERLAAYYARPGPSSEVMDEYLEYYAYQRKINPFLEKIQSIKWDGRSRVEDMWLEIYGASMEGTLDDKTFDKYLHALSRDWLTGIIARQFEPTRLDVIPMIIGEPGIGKTTLIERMGLGFYGSTTLDLEKPEGFYNAIRGKVIVELGEGSAIRRNNPDDLKEFLSRKEDQYRKAYGRREHNFVRRFGAIVTTNRAELLTDTTGNRRFFPIYCDSDKTRYSLEDLDDYWFEQLWAEALEIYKHEGVTNDLEEVKEISKIIQKLATVERAETTDINNYLDSQEPFNRVGCKITVRLIYAEVFHEQYPPYSKNVVAAVRNWQDANQDTWKAVNSSGILDIGRTEFRGRGIQRIKAPMVSEDLTGVQMAVEGQQTLIGGGFE